MKTALVTGASSGIGRATVRRLDAAGWKVFAGVRKEEDAAALRAESSPRLEPLILDITDAPETVDIVLINPPELPPAGAGESSIRPVAAAIANAVFDATGVRLRRAPLTPERLKPALA